MKNWTREAIIKRPLSDLSMISNNIKNKQELIQHLEELSKRAGMIAAYLSEREGYGCGDQGHEKAIKAMNKAGKTIWCKAFGYNAFHDLSF